MFGSLSCNSDCGWFVLYVGTRIAGLESDKMGNPPPYGWGNGTRMQPPPAAPPSYSQAVGGVGPSSPYTPQYPASKYLVYNIFHKIPFKMC